MNELFQIEESLSPRMAWIKEHNVLTHHATHLDDDPEEDPWMAIIPIEGHEGDIGEIMAEWCGLYDENDLIGWGKTKDEAIIKLALIHKLPLWNEPKPDACDVCNGSGVELHNEVESECQNCTQP